MARILVVDDEPGIRELVQLQLEMDGHEVVCANDGGEAMELATADPLPDLIVLDVMMPVLDGWEVLRQLKAHDDPDVAATPILLLTARAADLDKIRGGIEGAVSYVTKPFTIPVLRDAVDAALTLDEGDARRAAQSLAMSQLARLERGDAAGPPLGPSGPRINMNRLERRPDPPATRPAIVVGPAWGDAYRALSEKQRELLIAVGAHATVQDAAAALGVSRSNVYASLRRIGRRLGSPGVAELVTLCREQPPQPYEPAPE